MKKIYIILAAVLFNGGGYQAAAQAGLSKANRSYEQYAYADAIKIYEHISKKGKADAETLKKLGDAYYFNADYEKAGQWYGKLFEQFGPEAADAEHYYRYGQTLKSLGQKQEAAHYLQQYASKANASQRATLIQDNKDYAAEIRNNSGRYSSLTNLPVNTANADYGSCVYNNQLLFATARYKNSLSRREHPWTNKAFTSIYVANISKDGGIGQAGVYNKSIRSKLNESTAIITQDGETMYFTRNNYNKKRGYSAEKNTLLKIYKATMKNGKWSDVEELPFNSDDFSTAHPVLSSDGRTMYFVSDRPGGHGSSDIWKVSLTDGKFGTPQNMGPGINTEGRETFPFITENDELYFSSDSRPGLGGLDVYAVKIKPDGSVGEVQNVGEPINSPWDDFAYIINLQTGQGFFSSNRPGGKGNDDIYSFVETRALQLNCIQQLNVKAVDAQTGKVINGAEIVLLTETEQQQNSIRQTQDGYQVIASELLCGDAYRIKAQADTYVDSEVKLILSEESGITEQSIVLQKIEIVPEPKKKPEVKKGDDLFKVLKLNLIFFDLNKNNIRKDAAEELEKVAAVMKEYPKMKISVRSHTDSRGSDSYNLKLSERRAKSTAEWIISQGIDPSRVTYKGYGETRLLNECGNGVNCPDEKHQENRRSEFIVEEM